jgi:hypothetical protein
MLIFHFSSKLANGLYLTTDLLSHYYLEICMSSLIRCDLFGRVAGGMSQAEKEFWM